MKKLYIIGNGFDIAHGLKTSYWNFREYLDNTCPDFLEAFERLYNIEHIDFSDLRVPAVACEQWERTAKHELWSELEDKIGQPNITEMMDRSTSILADMEYLDGGLIEIEDTMNSYWGEQYGYIRKFEQYVKEWIETIDTSDIKPKRMTLMKSTDYFLNFNYTDLLENIYQIDDVLHIHGGVSPVTDIEPILGHCNYKDIEEHQKLIVEAEEAFNEGEAAINRAVVNYLKSIYKNTGSIIEFNRCFWDKLKDVEEVVIFGWSAGLADLSYLKKIRKSVMKSAKWYVYYYDDSAYKALNKTLQSEGIEEEFEVDYIPSQEFWN